MRDRNAWLLEQPGVTQYGYMVLSALADMERTSEEGARARSASAGTGERSGADGTHAPESLLDSKKRRRK